jgi:hypothetical protein
MFQSTNVTTTAKTIRDFSAYKSIETTEKHIKVKIFKFCKCQVCGKECVADNEQIVEQTFPNDQRMNVFNFTTEVNSFLTSNGLKKIKDVPETIQRKNDKMLCAICSLEASI